MGRKENNVYLNMYCYMPAFHFLLSYSYEWGHALRYKPEGRGFDSQWYHWNFSLT